MSQTTGKIADIKSAATRSFGKSFLLLISRSIKGKCRKCSLSFMEEVVRTLNNELRQHWDPENKYLNYMFVRQDQTFPDVLLQNVDSQRDIIMGIELKSWYLLSKEGEPSLRFKATANVCMPQDLFVVVPWVLSNVLSGTPIIKRPFIEYARYIADYRNYWWQHLRSTTDSVVISSPLNVIPYPNARDEISDNPINDKGNNFGRVARLGLMDDYVKEMYKEVLLGFTVSKWTRFFKEKEKL